MKLPQPMINIVIVSRFRIEITSNIAAKYLCQGDFMARLRGTTDKAIVYLNQVEEHIDMDANWVHSMLDEVNSMLEYYKNESMKKKEASLVAK